MPENEITEGPTQGITRIECVGFRGLATKQVLKFAQPNGIEGSGLTLIVGPNNSGKSSIIEALVAVIQSNGQSPTFSEGKRNIAAHQKIDISLYDSAGNVRSVKTNDSGGSETTITGETSHPHHSKIFVVPSRREFDPYFGRSISSRESYVQNQQSLKNTRNERRSFSGRIFNINGDPEKRLKFEAVLAKVIDPVPDWTIDQSDGGQYYLKYSNNGATHSSDGMGDGLLSIFVIVDALYDSEPGSMIVIDEPELSLHPELQDKLRLLLLQFSKDRQIVIATHSTKFVDWHAISNGSHIARVVSENDGTKIYELTSSTRDMVGKLLHDMNNPHTLGLDANEVFFLKDRVVLLEGQEDVMFLPRALNDLGKTLNATLYGWGVGGAQKMSTISSILKDLGFKKVGGVLDANVANEIPALKKDFPDFKYVTLPADDIRYKVEKAPQTSLLDNQNQTVRPEFRAPTEAMVDDMNAYFST